MDLMADEVQKTEEGVEIRTLRGDLEKISGLPPKPKEAEIKQPEVFKPFAKEAQVAPPPGITAAPPAAGPPRAVPEPVFKAPTPPAEQPQIIAPPLPAAPPTAGKPPVLVIPPKKVPEAAVRPLYKASPTWIKLGIIGAAVFLLTFGGLYAYWKLFIQTQPEPASPPPPPTLPVTAPATTTPPLKFFNKLPNKTITIDLPSKTPESLLAALKSEAAVPESLSLVKQINLTYLNDPLDVKDFTALMAVKTPENFLSNYESEFALVFFSQKEGSRPILILKAKDKSLAQTQMESWEAASLIQDVSPLFLTSAKIQPLSAFKSYLFINQPVRFVNINLPFASLNWALWNDRLIFSTSSAGMFVILQDLTGQTASKNELESLQAAIGEFTR